MIGLTVNAFQNRSVLVTGHTGFKGSWLTIWLTLMGARVTGYALPPAQRSDHFVTSRVRERMTAHCEGDILDQDHLHTVMQQSTPEVIFHLAAQSLVRPGYRDARGTFNVNVMGTVNVLEGVRRLGRPCAVIIVTSDKCYENHHASLAHNEADALGGGDPYSASKAAAELVTAAYRQSFFSPGQIRRHGVKLASARAGNVIGGGDWAMERIIPDCVRALQAGEPVRLRNPGAIRPWQHVLDPLFGYMLLAGHMLASDSPEWCSAWNFGPEPQQTATVRQLVEAICHDWGAGAWLDDSHPDQLHETSVLRLDPAKAAAGLNWRTRWEWREAIRRTAHWYRQFLNSPHQSTWDLCAQDIAAYETESGIERRDGQSVAPLAAKSGATAR